MKTWLNALAFCLATVAPAWAAAQPLPAYFPRFSAAPAGQQGSPQAVLAEEFGQAEIQQSAQAAAMMSGRRWSGEMGLTIPEAATAWARLKPDFLKAGWAVVVESDYQATLRYRKDGREAWCQIGFGDPSDIRFEIIERAAQQRQLTLAPPGAVPEVLRAAENIPYLTPPPDFRLVTGSFEDKVMVGQPGPDGTEAQVLGQGFHLRLYGGPEVAVSPRQAVLIYDAALKAAGWTVVRQRDNGLLAHYTRQGRDLWADVSAGSGDLTFMVADAGADNLAARLKRDCRAALNGVFFDFNRAVLKPESTPALTRARDALNANPGLAIEVQGHTDNVGQENYNLKLSEARAASVRQWLTGHGVDAGRLSARGYGKARPVADNDSDSGRARNRRVELACRK